MNTDRITLSQIIKFIIKVIKKYFNKLEPTHSKISKNYLKITYYFSLFILKQH